MIAFGFHHLFSKLRGFSVKEGSVQDAGGLMVSKTDSDLVFMELMSPQGRKTLNTHYFITAQLSARERHRFQEPM